MSQGNGKDHEQKRTCGNCAYYRIDPTDLKAGDCVREPPRVFIPAMTPKGPLRITAFPYVQGRAVCGCHITGAEEMLSRAASVFDLQKQAEEMEDDKEAMEAEQ